MLFYCLYYCPLFSHAMQCSNSLLLYEGVEFVSVVLLFVHCRFLCRHFIAYLYKGLDF